MTVRVIDRIVKELLTNYYTVTVRVSESERDGVSYREASILIEIKESKVIHLNEFESENVGSG